MSYIRDIEARDNQVLAQIIRSVLIEFGANKPGFAWQDPELDAMSQAYAPANRCYQVIDQGGVRGGAGIAEYICDVPRCCELQKMYLVPEARRQGWGKQLIQSLLSQARTLGYTHCYLETMSSMTGAIGLYRQQGFQALSQPLGQSGHNACDVWYLLAL